MQAHSLLEPDFLGCSQPGHKIGQVRRVVASQVFICGHPNFIVVVASKFLHVPGTHAVSTANFDISRDTNC
jgi:hypothetical protein